jgi:hypothetical protein
VRGPISTVRALRIFAIAWAARSIVDAALSLSYVSNAKIATAIALALTALATAALIRADIDRRMRIASTVVVAMLAFRAASLPNEPSRILEVGALACAFATARAAGAIIRGPVAIIGVLASFLAIVSERLPVPASNLDGEARSLLFTAASITVAGWGVLVPLDAASRIDPETKQEDAAVVARRREAFGFGAWLIGSLVFAFAAAFLAAEKMPTWRPYYVEAFASLLAATGAVALIEPAKQAARRSACIAAAIVWALHAVSLHLSVRFSQALLWDAMDGRDVAVGVAVSSALAHGAWLLVFAGVALLGAVLHGFAKHRSGDELVARIAAAATFPFAVGVILQLTRAGERPRSGWVDLAFAGCSALAFGMLAFAIHRIRSDRA